MSHTEALYYIVNVVLSCCQMSVLISRTQVAIRAALRVPHAPQHLFFYTQAGVRRSYRTLFRF
jgi:uncharacterized membrane protein